MALQQSTDLGNVCVAFERFQIDAGFIATTCGEVSLIVEDKCPATAHAGGKVAARSAEYDDGAVGHVFASMIADAFDHGGRAGIANREALAGYAVEKCFAAGSAVEDNVAHEYAFFRQEE